MAKAEAKQTVEDVMTTSPVVLQASTPITDAARMMREADIGDVMVLDDGEMCGIVTDRDIVVRAIAQGKDPAITPLRDICSRELTTITANRPVDEAIKLMRGKAIRRLPVMDGRKPIGVVSLGDLALERDPKSVLAGISGARPNK